MSVPACTTEKNTLPNTQSVIKLSKQFSTRSDVFGHRRQFSAIRHPWLIRKKAFQRPDSVVFCTQPELDEAKFLYSSKIFSWFFSSNSVGVGNLSAFHHGVDSRPAMYKTFGRCVPSVASSFVKLSRSLANPEQLDWSAKADNLSGACDRKS